MSDTSVAAPVPPDDPTRTLGVARPDSDGTLTHLGVVGDTYTILLSGQETAGRYTLIDMYVPPGGGPPPPRHDFEEMFTILDGEIELTFRGETLTARAGETVNIPANAAHVFTNASDKPARLLCMCSPAGQEEFFMAVGLPVSSRTEAPRPSTTRRPQRSSPRPSSSHRNTTPNYCDRDPQLRKPREPLSSYPGSDCPAAILQR